jgi:hypothetical protein
MMRGASFASVALLVISGYAVGQPPAQSAASSSAPTKLSYPSSRDCKKEVRTLCGWHPGDELQSCLHDGINLNKFSESCKAEITKPPKSGS